MTTIGDRIRLRRTIGKRGKRYSLCRTQPSRASEPNQDIPKQNEQQQEEVEAKAETLSQRETEHSSIDLTERQQEIR